MKIINISRSLYRDAIKQTKLVSIFAIIFCVYISIQVPISTVLNSHPTKSIAGFMDVAPQLMAVPYLFAPFLVYLLFNFMNKRNSSDFYHSLPIKRRNMYFSLMAAACTWIVLITVITAATGMVMHLIFNEYFKLNVAEVLISTLGILASSLYSAVVVSIAMVLTGTVFTNVVLSGIFLILPVIILVAFTTTIHNALPILTGEYVIYNILPCGFNFPVTDYGTDLFSSFGNNIYTLILAIVLILPAIKLFENRKSESASYHLQSEKLRIAFRMLCGAVASIFGTIFVLNLFLDKSTSADVNDVFMICTIYTIALLVYFGVELFMTKKPKMMIKAIPGLTVVLLINVVVFASLYGIYTLNMCFTPTPEEIDYIRLTNDDGYMGDDISYYLNSKAEKIKLKDKKLKEIVSSSLSYDIDTLKNGLYYEVEYNEKYDYPFMSSKTVVISVNGVERKRNIRFNASDYEALIDGLSNNNEYKKMYKELPEIGESFTSVYSTGDISEKKCEEIYNTLREEIAELDFDTWYSIVNYTKGAYIGKEEIYVSTMLDSEHYSIMLPINTELKDTIYKYIELTADKKSSDVILNGNGIADIDYLELTIYNEDQTELYYYFENTDDIKSVAEFLDPIDNLNDDCYIVVASYTSSDKWSECYFTVSKENLEYIGEVSPN